MFYLLHKEGDNKFNILLRMKATHENLDHNPNIIIQGIKYCGAHRILEPCEIKPKYTPESILEGSIVRINEETFKVILGEKVLKYKHKGFEHEEQRFEIYYLEDEE